MTSVATGLDVRRCCCRRFRQNRCDVEEDSTLRLQHVPRSAAPLSRLSARHSPGGATDRMLALRLRRALSVDGRSLLDHSRRTVSVFEKYETFII